MATIDELVGKYSELIFQQVKARVPSAGHEEEIRVEATKGIDRFIEEANLQVVSRHEYGLGGGRMDIKISFRRN